MAKVDIASVIKYGANNMRGNVIKNVGKPKTNTDGLTWGLPQYTDAELAALTPATGMIVYNKTSNKLNVYTEAAWEEITSS